MALMSCLQEQDPDKITARYHADKFPTILPQVQTGNLGECQAIKYNRYQRAGRKDAEPMIVS